MADVLISIRPVFVERVLAGTKSVELRRRPTRMQAGDRLFLYSSGPARQLVGTCVVGRVTAGRPRVVYGRAGRRADVSPLEFRAYARGAAILSAIELVDVKRFGTPVDLSRLRSLVGRFVVPQSYRYLSPPETALLESVADRATPGAIASGRREFVRRLAPRL